jgi:hypothetical protein
MMKAQQIKERGLLRAFTANFRPQQSPVARKVLPTNVSVKDTLSIPQSVFLTELRKAGDEHLCPVPELTRSTGRRRLPRRWRICTSCCANSIWNGRAFKACFLTQPATGCNSLVNRARVLRDEVDEISNANRN